MKMISFLTQIQAPASFNSHSARTTNGRPGHHVRQRFLALVMAAMAILTGLAGWTANAQTPHRPPAVPLVTNNPYFSIWSMADHLTDVPTRHWSGADQPMTGLIRIDGKTFRWMGVSSRQHFAMPDVPAMQQDSVDVTPLHTRYVFSAAGVALHVTFFTPLFPHDLDVLSRPVTYLSWTAASSDGRSHKVELLLDVSPMIAVNMPQQPVTWGRSQTKLLTMLSVGSRDQAELHQSGDRIRIDWGYFRVAVPRSESAMTSLSDRSMAKFATDGVLPDQDQIEMPRPAGWRAHAAHLDVELSLGDVGKAPVERHVLLAYTEQFAIEYLGRKLRPYWQRNGMNESAMLDAAEQDYLALNQRGNSFDHRLTADLEKAGGADYSYLATLAFRQTVAAHQLVADVDGQPMLFSKENDSNGCIDTVDVTYPSSPFFLLFNPRLLQAQLEPLMRYAALPRWRFPFAPHDLGTFPLADGQVYGGGEETADRQMPVEESADLILMVDALGQAENDWSFAKRYMPQLTQWAQYLEQKGLDPENQLSTDDFAGRLAHNANLSLKAIEALGAFAQIAEKTGDPGLGRKFRAVVRPMPAEWEKMARDGDHYKLAFNDPGSWSQKYNLVWDDLLGLHLFSPTVAKTEWAFYSTKMQPYGLPLDSRKTLTKLDWELWTGTLTTDSQQFAALMHRLVDWADHTEPRVPLTDFYDTVSGRQIGFQARSVVGGMYIKALSNPDIARRWRAQ